MRLPAQLRKRNKNSHKGDYGHVLIIGGSRGFAGAAVLCAKAVLRSGAGLVTAAIPKSLVNIFTPKLIEAMTLPLEEKTKGYFCLKAFNQIEKILDKIDVIAIGCGASKNENSRQLILKVIKKIDKPMVIDADGLNALAENIGVLDKCKSGQIVLTPHAQEFGRLLGISAQNVQKKRKELVKEFTLRYNLTLVLKGNRTLAAKQGKIFENTTGNPGMGTAGSGDVLSGIIAAFLAQGIDDFFAAKLGVYLHGLAGDIAAEEKTQISLIASDIIEYLPRAIKKCLFNSRPGSSIGRAPHL